MTRTSSKGVVRLIAIVMTFALFATSLAYTPAKADAKKAKVSKVSITKPSTKVLVLKKGKSYKIKKTVKASKAKYKKVTFKSSKPKVATVSKSGKIKAKAKGTAKITVTSKTNKKKKATLTVKVGTPITKITLNGTKGELSYYYKDVTNVETKVVSQKKFSKTIKTKLFTKKKSASVTLKKTEWVTLKANYTPKKATYRKVKYKSSNKKAVTVNSLGIAKAIGEGKATITVTAADGSGKKAKVKITVGAAPPIVTAKYVPKEVDTRKRTMVEDFESYAVGTTWKLTKGENYKTKNCATATVVTDPADASNKLLKIAYDGDTQAYDVAPIFSVDLTKLKDWNDSTKLENFVGFDFKTKVEANTSDVNYKGVYTYFADYGTINENYYNATSQTTAGEFYKFKTAVNMAKGEDKEFQDEATKRKDNYKVFPMFYDGFNLNKEKCTPGYSETANDKNLKMAQRITDFQLPYMKDQVSGKNLLDLSKVDFTLGSTYSGSYKTGGFFVNLYLDDIQLLSETQTTDVQEIKIDSTFTRLGTGISRKLTTSLVPSNTTQKKVKWSTSDEEIATIDDAGVVTGVAPGEVTLTVTSVEKPSVAKSTTLTIYETGTETVDRVIDLSQVTAKADTPEENKKVSTEIDTVYDNDDGSLTLKFTANNEAAIIDLGAAVDFTAYNSIEIVGVSAGQIAMELYGEDLDKQVDKYYETLRQGDTYPFFKGSCSSRLEDGAYDTDALDLTTETLWYKWNDLTDDGTSDKSKGDFTAIRYILLKSNADPAHPMGTWEESICKIKSLKLSTKVAPEQYLPVDVTELNESAATSTTKVPTNAAYTSALFEKTADEVPVPYVTFVSNSRRNSGIAFYLDSVKKEGNVTTDAETGVVTVKHNDSMDISGYRYVKVKVKSEDYSNLLSVVGLTAGNTIANATVLKKETSVAAGERTIYFSIKDADDSVLSSLDSIGIKPSVNGATTTIHSIELVRGEPLVAAADLGVNTFIVR